MEYDYIIYTTDSYFVWIKNNMMYIGEKKECNNSCFNNWELLENFKFIDFITEIKRMYRTSNDKKDSISIKQEDWKTIVTIW